MSLKIHGKLSIAVFVYMWDVSCGNLTIQHIFKNCYFFWKSGGFTYLGLAAALAAWYNTHESKDNCRGAEKWQKKEEKKENKEQQKQEKKEEKKEEKAKKKEEPSEKISGIEFIKGLLNLFKTDFQIYS